jgi:hypothetical protein
MSRHIPPSRPIPRGRSTRRSRPTPRNRRIRRGRAIPPGRCIRRGRRIRRGRGIRRGRRRGPWIAGSSRTGPRWRTRRRCRTRGSSRRQAASPTSGLSRWCPGRRCPPPGVTDSRPRGAGPLTCRAPATRLASRPRRRHRRPCPGNWRCRRERAAEALVRRTSTSARPRLPALPLRSTRLVRRGSVRRGSVRRGSVRRGSVRRGSMSSGPVADVRSPKPAQARCPRLLPARCRLRRAPFRRRRPFHRRWSLRHRQHRGDGPRGRRCLRVRRPYRFRTSDRCPAALGPRVPRPRRRACPRRGRAGAP